MVHQGQPNQDPARRHNAVHGRRSEEQLERHGEHLPAGVLGLGSWAEVDGDGGWEDCVGAISGHAAMHRPAILESRTE